MRTDRQKNRHEKAISSLFVVLRTRLKNAHKLHTENLYHTGRFLSPEWYGKAYDVFASRATDCAAGLAVLNRAQSHAKEKTLWKPWLISLEA
jgi:hypothetical protein